MKKRQRIEALLSGEVPDCMPVFASIWTHGVYCCGWRLPDITGQDHLDVEKSAQTVFSLVEKYDLDIVYGSYLDFYLGMTTLGGVIRIYDAHGAIVGPEKYPVESQLDWPKVKKKLVSVFEKDDRIKAVLESIKIVSREIGDEVPISVIGLPGGTAAVGLLRDPGLICRDMIKDPKFAYELCDYANKFTIDFIRRQYDAGANSVTILGDVFGTELISSKMYEKFGLPFVAQIVDVVKKEFNQKVFMHVHGDFKTTKNNPILDILVNEIGVGALHLDEKHDPLWVKENIHDKYKIPGAIVYHGVELLTDTVEKIDEKVKAMISGCNQNYCYMAPSCECPPNITGDNLHSWIQKTREHSADYYKGHK